MAEERGVNRCDVCSPDLLKSEEGDSQRGEKVIASRIGPRFADQTEGFKRFPVVPNVIDDGHDEFLWQIFASRRGHSCWASIRTDWFTQTVGDPIDQVRVV